MDGSFMPGESDGGGELFGAVLPVVFIDPSRSYYRATELE